jgi:hypothetical protein
MLKWKASLMNSDTDWYCDGWRDKMITTELVQQNIIANKRFVSLRNSCAEKYLKLYNH